MSDQTKGSGQKKGTLSQYLLTILTVAGTIWAAAIPIVLITYATQITAATLLLLLLVYVYYRYYYHAEQLSSFEYVFCNHPLTRLTRFCN